ncbi:MAG: hypothetical protein HYV63_11915 [Candidatus Schekmanbacteria bacterium]|nr:hypothetical protein [Candidatus Schekmanbacteria bacterium]
MRPLRILFTNIQLDGYTGTETSVRDLSVGLARLGHATAVYSPRLGPIAEEMAKAGVTIARDLSQLAVAPDIIHGHHHVEVVEAMMRFPEATALFVCNDSRAWHDIPPPWRGIRRFVAVDLNTRERLSAVYGIADDRIEVVLNWVDTGRFVPGPPLPPAPARALVFSNNAGPSTHLEPVESACRDLGLPLDVVGLQSGRPVAHPEVLLGSYHLVFAKAKCAIEAVACGAAVVLCDTPGLGPMVSTENVSYLRQWNFGMRCLQRPLHPGAIRREIERYDAADAAAVRDRVRREADLTGALQQYLDLYRRLLSEPRERTIDTPMELRDYLTAGLRRMQRFELSLGQDRMAPLPPDVSGMMELRIVSAPAGAQVAAVFRMIVEIRNDSNETLRSSPPFPVHLSYHWYGVDREEVVVFEGERTPLVVPLNARETRSYTLSVQAPVCPATYRLCATLVQENVRWFDLANPPVADQVAIRVAAATR